MVSYRDIDLYYIAIMKESIPILEINFQSENMIPETILLTGFVSAISAFSKEFIKGELKTIDHGELKLTFVEGNLVSILVLSFSISENLRKLIKTILTEFEEKYNLSLQTLNMSSFEYEEFKENIIEKYYNFKFGKIKEYYVPIIGSNNDISLLESEAKMIYQKINGTVTVAEIAEDTNLTIAQTTQILVPMLIHNIIDFKITIDSYDIPKLTSLGLNNLFNSPELFRDLLSNLVPHWNQVVQKIDGVTSVKRLSEIFSIKLYNIRQVMTQLIERDYITLVSDKIKLCLMFEKFYSKLYHTIKDIMGARGVVRFKEIINSKSNLLRNLVIVDDQKISFEKIILHVGDQEDLQIDDVGKTLAPPINQILKNLEKSHGSKYVENLKITKLKNLSKQFSKFEVNLLSEFLKMENKNN